MCVALFAWTSGYGLSASLKRFAKDDKFQLVLAYRNATIRLIRFLFMYLVVFVVSAPILYYRGIITETAQLLLGLLTYRTDFNGGWWYVHQYEYFLCIAPGLAAVFYGLQRKKWKTAVLGIVVSVIVALLFHFVLKMGSTLYLLIFLEAFIASWFELYEELFRRFDELSTKPSKVIAIAAIFVLCGARLLVTHQASYSSADVVIIPLLVFCVVVVGRTLEGLEWIGMNCFWLWLVSTMIQACIGDQLRVIRVSILYYAAILVGSIVVAAVLKKLYKGTLDCLYKKIKIGIAS